jgi:hypothetical protein
MTLLQKKFASRAEVIVGLANFYWLVVTPPIDVRRTNDKIIRLNVNMTMVI